MNRLTVILALLSLFVPASLFAQCPDLNPLDDGSGVFGAIGLPDLVISEVNPGDYVELFNRTDTDIVLPGIYWLCSDLLYAQVAGTVPAKGYATVIWPANFTRATNTSGEMILFKSGNFGTSTDILDYVIWGSPAFNRKNQALAVGKWSGANCTALTNGAVHRLIGVKGTIAADYDNTSAPSPLNCEPPTSVRDTPPLAGAKIWSRPNPFAMNTTVEFQLDSPAAVEVSIYSIDGALVRTLAAQSFTAGIHALHWDGADATGRPVASGTYLARITGGVTAATRMTLVR